MILRYLLILSVVLVLRGGAFAQSQKSRAVEPTATPQEIDEPVGKQPFTKAKAKQPLTVAPKKEIPTGEGVVINEGETVEGFTIAGGKATIHGRVKGDLHAKSSLVIIEKHGSVEGSLILEDSTLENHSESAVKVKGMESNTALAPTATADIARIEYSKEVAVEKENRPNWFAQQTSIWFLALLCGGLFAVTAPVVTRKVTYEVATEPVRCLIIGGITALVLSMIAVLNANLMHFSIRLLSLAWSPLGFGISVLLLGVVAFSWVCGLNHFGNFVALKMGRADSGALLGRILLGASTLFLVSLILGGTLSSLAVFALLIQGLLAILGMGATVITGFGREPNWLGSYLSQAPRFSGRF